MARDRRARLKPSVHVVERHVAGRLYVDVAGAFNVQEARLDQRSWIFFEFIHERRGDQNSLKPILGILNLVTTVFVVHW